MICISFYLNLTGFGFVSVKAQTADLCAEQLEGAREPREEGGVGIKQIKHNERTQ